MQKEKNFKNKVTKTRSLKQLFNYFNNRFGDSTSIKPKKDKKDFTNAIVKEDLKNEYLDNKDIR